MLQSILAALHLDQPDSLKRALATGIGAAVVVVATIVVNPFLASHGLPPLSDAVLQNFDLSVAGLVATFVLQSGVKAAAVAHAEAVRAQLVPTPSEAAKSLDEAVAAGSKGPTP